MDAVSTTRHFEWKIHNFKDFIENNKKNQRIKSEQFVIKLEDEEINWHFSANSENENLSIYLYKGCFGNNFIVKFEVYVCGLGNKLKFRNAFIEHGSEFKLCSGLGFDMFSFENFSKIGDEFLENGTLTLWLKVQLIKNAQSNESDLKCVEKCQYLEMCKDLFKTKSFSDIIIICSDDVKIRAHRFILNAFSPVIKTMLNIDDSTVHIFDIKDISSAVMTEILRFMYTQKLSGDDKLLPKILYGAEKYKIVQLKETCVIKMMENLSVTNAFEYFFSADQYDVKDLLEDCIMFMKLHHDELRNDEQWNKFEKKHWMMFLDCYRQSIENVHIFESTI